MIIQSNIKYIASKNINYNQFDRDFNLYQNNKTIKCINVLFILHISKYTDWKVNYIYLHWIYMMIIQILMFFIYWCDYWTSSPNKKRSKNIYLQRLQTNTSFK